MEIKTAKQAISDAVENVRDFGYYGDNGNWRESDFENESDFNAYMSACMPEYTGINAPGFTFIVPRYMWTFKGV